MNKQPSKKSFKTQISQFSRIPRFITEKRLKYVKLSLFSLICIVLLVLSIAKLAEIRRGLLVIQLQTVRHEELLIQKQYWEDVLRRHPGYRDASFKLAALSYQLGLMDQAGEYIDQVLQIDPNFKPGRVFKEKLPL